MPPVGPRPPWPAGVARVAVSGVTQTHRWVNVFYLQLAHTNPVTVNDLQTIANAVANNYPVQASTNINNATTLTGVDISFIPTVGTVIDFSGTYSITGTGTATPSDAGGCYLVDWTISSRYRGGHPRTYLPGVVSGAVTNGSDISSATQTTIVNLANTLRNTLNALTTTNVTAVTMGTVHFAKGNVWLSPPTFDAYTSVKYGHKGKLASQRRRITS